MFITLSTMCSVTPFPAVEEKLCLATIQAFFQARQVGGSGYGTADSWYKEISEEFRNLRNNRKVRHWKISPELDGQRCKI